MRVSFTQSDGFLDSSCMENCIRHIQVSRLNLYPSPVQHFSHSLQFIARSFSSSQPLLQNASYVDFLQCRVYQDKCACCAFQPPLPNGNTTGLGVVIRDDEGVILAILTGSLGHINPRANELWAIQLRLQMAFKLSETAIELEIESAATLREWDDHRWFTNPRYTRMVEQLNQRLSIGRLRLEKRVIAPSQKCLPGTWRKMGAATKFRVVRIFRPFGRVSELWHLDMGLGFIGGNFAVVDEDDYEAMQQQQMEVEEKGQAVEARQGEESVGSVGGDDLDQAFLDCCGWF